MKKYKGYIFVGVIGIMLPLFMIVLLILAFPNTKPVVEMETCESVQQEFIGSIVEHHGNPPEMQKSVNIPGAYRQVGVLVNGKKALVMFNFFIPTSVPYTKEVKSADFLGVCMDATHNEKYNVYFYTEMVDVKVPKDI